MAADNGAHGRGPGVQVRPGSEAAEAPAIRGVAFDYRSETRTGKESKGINYICNRLCEPEIRVELGH